MAKASQIIIRLDGVEILRAAGDVEEETESYHQSMFDTQSILMRNHRG